MKKFFMSVFLISVLSFSIAHSLNLAVEFFSEPTWSVEYAYPVTEELDVLVGAAFDFQPLTVDALLGVHYLVFAPEGVDVGVVGRIGMPIYNGEVFEFGQTYGTLGVLVVPQQGGMGSPVFEFGVRSDLTREVFSTVPDFYGRLGIQIRF